MTGSSRKSRTLRLFALLAGGAILLGGLGGCVIRGGYGCGPVIWRVGFGACH